MEKRTKNVQKHGFWGPKCRVVKVEGLCGCNLSRHNWKKSQN